MSFVIRTPVEADLPSILELLHLKADFDGYPGAMEATTEALGAAWFVEPPVAHALVASADDGSMIGLATYFYTFSSFTARPGLWLDDLFVREADRSRGVGAALLAKLARTALDRGCARMEWTVALGNERGISFYERHGASVRRDGRCVRLGSEALARLAGPRA